MKAKNKTLKTNLFLLSLLCAITACSSHPKNDRRTASISDDFIKENIQSTTQYLKDRQLPDHSFAGAFVADISQEAVFLTLGKKLNLMTEETKDLLLKSVFARMDASTLGWISYPGGGVDHSTTGFMLRALENQGINRNDERVKKAWEFYLKSGGDKKLNASSKLQMGMLGLLPAKDSVPPIPPELLNVNYKYGMKYIGIHGQLLYSLLGVSILKEVGDKKWSKHSLKSEDYLSMPIVFGENYEHKKIYTKRSSLELAKMSLAYSLQTRGTTNGWYGALFTSSNLLFLHEAQRVGLGNFEEEIKAGYDAMKGWITKSEEGFMVVQPSKSDVWDTASTVNALNALPSEFESEKDILQNDKAVEWLIKKKIHVKDKKLSIVWSFDSTDKMLPDLDDTAAVVHALATSKSKDDEEVKRIIRTSVQWVLDRQNNDGGFPAWSKGVSRALFGTLEKFADLPKMSDTSQADVSARVLHMLHTIGPLNIIEENKIANAKSMACKYFDKSAETVSNIPTRTYAGHWVSNYAYSSTHLIKGLIYGECKNSKKWIKELTSWLMSVQQVDGGWGEDNISYIKEKYVSAKSTMSQSSLTLVGLIEAYDYLIKKDDHETALLVKESIDKGVLFLTKTSKNGTQFFEKEFTAIMIKGAMYARYELLNAYSTLYVLGRWYGR